MSEKEANINASNAYLIEMQKELAANAWKGEWITLDMTTLLQELYYHVSKLHVEIRKRRDVNQVRELTADIGNIAMFIADTAGALPRIARCVSCMVRKEIVRACMCEYCLDNKNTKLVVPPLTWIEPHWEGRQYAKSYGEENSTESSS